MPGCAMLSTELLTVFLLIHIIKGIPVRPPLPDIDTCTPRGGTCLNNTLECQGFIDTWQLCKNKFLCCRAAPSSVQPEPQKPETETCGIITRVKRTTSNPLLRIIGGDPAQEGEWPWIVSLKDSSGHFCGGTLVSNRWIVTAAHCLERKTVQEVNVTLGEHHLVVTTENEVRRGIETWIVHPDYEPDSLINDIALIRLVEEVSISNHYIRTACLPVNNDSYPLNLNTECYTSGWGYTRDFDTDRRHLQHLKVPLIPVSDCNDTWSGMILDGHICAGNGDTGSCQGDSGGPLVCQVGDQFVLIGVTSWGAGSCLEPGHPDVYTYTLSYMTWIHETMGQYDIVQYSISDVFSRFIRQMIDTIMEFIKDVTHELTKTS